jgi:CDP-diacylglycerol--glycerol-3-phosphate 3-phosphatidyltransferase
MANENPGADSILRRLAKFKERKEIRRLMLLLPDWITPNRVTVSRAVLMLPFIGLVLMQSYGLAWLMFALAMSLDFVDGALAEARQQFTELGAFLDPLVDKLVICFALLALAGQVPMGWLVFIGELGISVALTWLRVQKMQNRTADPDEADIRARPIGKFKLLTQVCGVSLMLLGLANGWISLVWVGSFAMMIAILLGIMSLKSHVSPG